MEVEKWITVRGHHVPIYKDKNKIIKEYVKKKQSNNKLINNELPNLKEYDYSGGAYSKQKGDITSYIEERNPYDNSTWYYERIYKKSKYGDNVLFDQKVHQVGKDVSEWKLKKEKEIENWKKDYNYDKEVEEQHKHNVEFQKKVKQESVKQKVKQKGPFTIEKQKSDMSESEYYNLEINDKDLYDVIYNEFNDLTIRYSKHKRPAYSQNGVWYEHNYFINTNDKEDFNKSKKYLNNYLKSYIDKKITKEELLDKINKLSYNEERRKLK